MSFHNVDMLSPLSFFARNVQADLNRLNLDTQCSIIGNKIHVVFDSDEDMHLYKLVGHYVEGSNIKFFVGEHCAK